MEESWESPRGIWESLTGILEIPGIPGISYMIFEVTCPSKKISEPSKHLKANRTHSFTWEIVANAPNDHEKRKVLATLYVAKYKPGLNEQVKSKKLKLFPNGLT